MTTDKIEYTIVPKVFPINHHDYFKKESNDVKKSDFDVQRNKEKDTFKKIFDKELEKY
ncbi:MAG: hypothetical protein RR290_02585 [Clostridia bacterium]